MPRAKDPSELVAPVVLPPAGLRVSRMRLGTDELAVLSFPLGCIAFPDSLTEAERAVARAMLAGESNAQIAVARQTSLRTVDNQIASILRKLHVRSRSEAFAALCRPHESQPQTSLAGGGRGRRREKKPCDV
jgi:DNA-binding NarL/FixJ family response regulator